MVNGIAFYQIGSKSVVITGLKCMGQIDRLAKWSI